MDQQQQSNKPHRASKEGQTAKKKLHSNGNNAKAFAVNAPGKLQRQAMQSSDVSSCLLFFYSFTLARSNRSITLDKREKFHVPMVDRTQRNLHQLLSPLLDLLELEKLP